VNKKIWARSAPILFVVLLLLACGGGGGGTSGPALVANLPPVANAGIDQTVGVGVTVNLDGTASSDANNDSLTYSWVLTAQPTGSKASIADTKAPKTSFIADVPGRYTASLVVSDGKSSSNSAVVTVTSTWILKSFVIADQTDSYKSLCASPVISFVIPVRLNEDNLLDFFVHYWCSAPTTGGVLTTATPDVLVALVSQSDGSYKASNEQVFGSKEYKLGGASRKYVRGDINGDGRDDFAFAMNWEDGRLAADPTTNATQLSVLLSTTGSTYKVERLGNPNWNHAVEIVRNADSVDVVTSGFACCRNTQAFRWRSGVFSDVSTEYLSSFSSNWASAFRAIHDPTTGLLQHIAGVATRQAPSVKEYSLSEIGIQLVRKNTTGFSLLSEFWKKVAFTVNWTSWQLTTGTNSVVLVNGKQYFGGAYDEICIMPPLRSGGPRFVVAKVGVAADKLGRTLVPGGHYSELDTVPANILDFYEIANGVELKSVTSPMVNEEIVSNYNRFECKDINGDSLPDLVAYAFTRPGFNERIAERGKPTVYINNGKEQLVRADISALPGHSAGNELQSVMTDVNADGVTDLLLFGSATDSGGGAIEVHLLRSPLRAP